VRRPRPGDRRHDRLLTCQDDNSDVDQFAGLGEPSAHPGLPLKKSSQHFSH
jgi:hypothetical protein